MFDILLKGEFELIRGKAFHIACRVVCENRNVHDDLAIGCKHVNIKYIPSYVAIAQWFALIMSRL